MQVLQFNTFSRASRDPRLISRQLKMVGKQGDLYDEALPNYEANVYQNHGIIDTIGDGSSMDGDLGFGSLCRYFKAKLRETEDNYTASNVRTWRLDIVF